MSTSSLGVGSTAGSPITISGLASGLETSKIIGALMEAEREPVTHLTDQEDKLKAGQTELQSIQSSLQPARARGLRIQPPRRCSKTRRRSPPTNRRG